MVPPLTKKIIVLIVALTPILVADASAQSMTLDEIRDAYRSLQLDVAERELRQIIASPAGHSLSDLTESHLLLGVILHTRGRNEEARTQFLSALQLDASARPSELDTSPKTLAFFEDARRSFEESLAVQQPASEITYVRVADVRPAAAMRSMVVPGWGQFYRGDTNKGLILGSAWLLSAGGTVAAHFYRRDAKKSYESETDPDRVADRFDTFKRWNTRRGIASIAAGAVWAVAYVDAISSRGSADVEIAENVYLSVGGPGHLAAVRVQIP